MQSAALDLPWMKDSLSMASRLWPSPLIPHPGSSQDSLGLGALAYFIHDAGSAVGGKR
jgi:hypothetical protein